MCRLLPRKAVSCCLRRKTCLNGKMAGRLLEKAGIAYELIDAQEQAQLSERFSIMQAPTLVVVIRI